MARRINRKNLALTYPRCPIDKDDMLLHLRSCFASDTEINYLIVCQEQHADGGFHLHAFIQLKMAINLKTMDRFDYKLGDVVYHANIEEANSVKNWIMYCKKGKNWVDWGNNPLATAKLTKKEMNDLIINENLMTLVDNGTINLKDLPRWSCAKESYKLLHTSKRRTELEVKWYYGSTGTGKTRKANDEAGEDSWTCGKDLQWFDGYNGQTTAILDDLRASCCEWGYLLRLLDIYPLTVPIKGGFARWCPKVIIITAPCLPEDMFKHKESGQVWDKIDQLKRRIKEYRNFDEQPYNPTPENSENSEDSSETMQVEVPPFDDLETAIRETHQIDQEVAAARSANPGPDHPNQLYFSFSSPEENMDTGFISQGNLPSFREKR